MIDLASTVIAQYSNSPVLLSMLGSINSALDSDAETADFYNKVFNIATAQGYGLDVWGRILRVSRKLLLPQLKSQYFGFSEANGWQPWGQAQFWDGCGQYSIYTLGDTEYRRLLMVKAHNNISNLSIENMNFVLNALFGDTTKCYVQDNLDMTIYLVFETPLTLIQASILVQSDLLPRPMGIKSYIVDGIGTTPLQIQYREVIP